MNCATASDSGLIEGLSSHISLRGFVRQRISVNMEDPVETGKDDQFDLSMVRSTLYLQANFRFEQVSITTISRFDWEYLTGYLRRLDRLSTRNFGGAYDDYDLREYYADMHLFDDRLFLRIGKQQVVWGKTDFFRGLDVIHGFDYRWRSFLEPENELVRKPLILINAEVQVPEFNGGLQLVVRPGLDRKKDIGNTYDAFGGRWANQPGKGTDSLGSMKYNLEHSEGDRDDWTYGFRWSGHARGMEYSVNYLRTFNNDPVVNASSGIGARTYHGEPDNGFAEFIYPQVTLAGFTLNYYLPGIDTLVRCEVSYTWDQPYNFGRSFNNGSLPGFAGIIEKDTVRTMMAFDKNIDWVKTWLGACRPGFLNVQLFDTWLVDYEKHDDIVAAAGYGARIHRHNTTLTTV
ncbi:MAG: LysR family transcriptional regulator, partial [Deltaproteobacteria bacterium]|nr:LysR family transcriptional regulator [Deltaproteobacteria bacterium]